MSEVTSEEQAVMAVKLADDVRNLIRTEIKAALEDYFFVQNLHPVPLSQNLAQSISVVMIGRGYLNAEIYRIAHDIVEQRASKFPASFSK